MNERIKELALEAGGSTYPEVNSRQLQKFAELIVQECFMKVIGAKIRSETYDELIARIKEDFGVTDV